MANINTDYYNNLSRYYKNVNVVSINISNQTKAFPLMMNQPTWTDDDIRYFYTVDESEAGRLDLIAFNVYGNTRLWWAIASANQLYDTINRPVRGDILKIPSLDAIGRYI